MHKVSQLYQFICVDSSVYECISSFRTIYDGKNKGMVVIT